MTQSAPLIQCRGLTKVYPLSGVEVMALRGIDLDIDRGEMVAIMGPSGSGKSTLLNILGGMDRQTSGTYILEGVEVNQLDDRELSILRNKRLGVVFQARWSTTLTTSPSSPAGSTVAKASAIRTGAVRLIASWRWKRIGSRSPIPSASNVDALLTSRSAGPSASATLRGSDRAASRSARSAANTAARPPSPRSPAACRRTCASAVGGACAAPTARQRRAARRARARRGRTATAGRRLLPPLHQSCCLSVRMCSKLMVYFVDKSLYQICIHHGHILKHNPRFATSPHLNYFLLFPVHLRSNGRPTLAIAQSVLYLIVPAFLFSAVLAQQAIWLFHPQSVWQAK